MYIVNPWAVQANFRALASQGEGSGVLSTKTPDGRIGLRGSLSKAPIVPRVSSGSLSGRPILRNLGRVSL